MWAKVLRYFWNLFIAIDQLVNTILGGDPDETISSRTGKAKAEGKLWAKILGSFLDLFERRHVEKSIESDEGDDQVIKF